MPRINLLTILLVVAFTLALGTIAAVAWIRNEVAAIASTRSHKSTKAVYSIKDQQEFDSALKRLDVEAVKQLLESGVVNPNGIHSEQETTPLYRIVSENQEKPEVLAIVQLLLDAPGIEPNGDFRSWTPLKMAVSKRMMQVIKLILAHPRTIPEVHVTGLPCSAQRDLDPSIYLIVPPHADECWASHPRRISEATSKLMKTSRKILDSGSSKQDVGGKAASSASARSAPSNAGSASSTKSQYDPNNPFQEPLPGILPPRDAYIMNPKAFPHIADAIVYYFFGNVFSSPLMWSVMIALCSGHFAVVMFLSWTVIRASEEHERQHQRPPNPAPQPEAGAAAAQ